MVSTRKESFGTATHFARILVSCWGVGKRTTTNNSAATANLLSSSSSSPSSDVLVIKTNGSGVGCSGGNGGCGGLTRVSKRGVVLTVLFVFLGSYSLSLLLFSPRTMQVLDYNAFLQQVKANASLNDASVSLVPLARFNAPIGPYKENEKQQAETDDNDDQDNELKNGTTTTTTDSNRVRFPRTKRRLPQCIIIGVRKCGTRALLEFLNIHPHVVTAKQEVHFFDKESRYALGLEWYRRKMPYSFANQITAEKSPAYFVTPHVPHRIYAMNRTVKLLLIVREPVNRAVSDYTQIQTKNILKGKVMAPFETLASTPDGGVNADYYALQFSMYANYLHNWFKLFPRKQVHVVDGDRLVSDPYSEMRKVEDFLGLEHRITNESFYFNKTKGFYCLRSDRTEQCLDESKGRKHPAISREFFDKLKRFYVPHNERFFTMIGRNLSWSTL